MCPSPRCSRSKRGGVKEAAHGVVGDRDGAQRGVHRSALEGGAGRRLDQQFGGAGEGGSVDAIAEDPPQRLHATHLTSGDRRFRRGGAPHLRNVASHFAGSEVVEERVHHLRRGEAQRRGPSGEVGVPVVREPQGEHRLVGFVSCVRDGTNRLDELEHPASHRIHRLLLRLRARRPWRAFTITWTTARCHTHRPM